MNILQVNYTDVLGGAAQIAYALHEGFRSRGEDSWMAVGKKTGSDPYVFSFSDVPVSRFGRLFHSLGSQVEQSSHSNFGRKFGRFFQQVSRQPSHYFYKLLGVDDFDYSDTWHLMQNKKKPFEIVNLHNLHSNYFDLRFLPVLSRQAPTIITLHDAWLLSGHCAHSLDCEGWKKGCGNCPYLNTDPPVMRDATAYNWQRKKKIYQNAHLYIVSPSGQLLNKVKDSVLHPAVKMSKLIRNGINLSIFKPIDRSKARAKLNLPQDAFVCLFVAVEAQKNSYKDYQTIRKALKLVSNQWQGKRIVFIALGGEAGNKMDDGLEVSHVAFIGKLEDVALYYQAADIYLHAARAETFPNTVIEALACGTPVIATGVGGIPEQIKDGETGFITLPSDETAMAERILRILGSNELRSKLASNAALEAGKRFGSESMITEYHSFYKEVIKDWKGTFNQDMINSG